MTGNIEADGNIYATQFHGDGSNLTNLPAGSSDMDDAYNNGSSVTVDSTDVIYNLNSTQDFHIQDAGGAAFTVLDNGNVGIGTTSPSYKLHVNGSVAGVGAYNNLSDRRLKRDIASLSNPLDDLLQIQGVKYEWRRDENPDLDFPEGSDMGVIAQDVQKVFPEAVSESQGGILSVAYTKLIAPIIEAIRELSRQSDLHEKKLQEKDQQIASLKAEKDREVASLRAKNSEKDEQIKQLNKRLKVIESILLKNSQ